MLISFPLCRPLSPVDVEYQFLTDIYDPFASAFLSEATADATPDVASLYFILRTASFASVTVYC